LPKKKFGVLDTNDDEESDDGNMLNDLDKEIRDSFGGGAKEAKEDEKDKLFALGDSHATLDRVTKNFKIAKSRALNEVSIEDYHLSPALPVSEQEDSDVDTEAF
jgi:Ser/Thr protein kinase RdoA (MazF antagonist)